MVKINLISINNHTFYITKRNMGEFTKEVGSINKKSSVEEEDYYKAKEEGYNALTQYKTKTGEIKTYAKFDCIMESQFINELD